MTLHKKIANDLCFPMSRHFSFCTTTLILSPIKFSLWRGTTCCDWCPLPWNIATRHCYSLTSEFSLVSRQSLCSSYLHVFGKTGWEKHTHKKTVVLTKECSMPKSSIFFPPLSSGSQNLFADFMENKAFPPATLACPCPGFSFSQNLLATLMQEESHKSSKPTYSLSNFLPRSSSQTRSAHVHYYLCFISSVGK